MFDKLIESNSEEAEFKPRRKFFMVSSVVVGILFVTAVVASLYAQNIDLGTDSFDMVELLAPVATDAPEPEPPQVQPERNTNLHETSELPNRRDLIARIDQVQDIPNEISTTPNTKATIPETGRFTNLADRPDSNSVGDTGGDSRVAGTSSAPELTEPVEAKDPPPPAVTKPALPKPPVSIGVVTGKATYLPKPPYTPAALAVGASGDVAVQVTIDETGKVISAKAVSGHPLLKQGAERAAWNARFEPTTLSKIPTKVTGVIVYKFSRN